MNCPHCGTHIDEHPASRCLDAWVADDIFGGSANPDNVLWYWWDSSDDEGKRVVLGVHLFAGPKFSTDIAAAWQVLGKMGGFWTVQGYIYEGRTNHYYAGRRGHVGSRAPTAPHAICRAAIKASQ